MLYFKELLNEWVLDGKTIVFSTHDVDLTYEWADNVIVLREGKVLKTGTVEEVLDKEDTYSEAGLVKPMLYDLFSQSNYRPRDIALAKQYIK